ncbi:hypothetical protein VNO78_20148 [Psophocarpus tetragonolobus]|uniref:Uncharacterized protein n=1 Tax=Psophocarpus tetragonolobus TaxID=3891 RepID=A0AAN9S8V3_PSOTE
MSYPYLSENIVPIRFLFLPPSTFSQIFTVFAAIEHTIVYLLTVTPIFKDIVYPKPQNRYCGSIQRAVGLW